MQNGHVRLRAQDREPLVKAPPALQPLLQELDGAASGQNASEEVADVVKLQQKMWLRCTDPNIFAVGFFWQRC